MGSLFSTSNQSSDLSQLKHEIDIVQRGLNGKFHLRMNTADCSFDKKGDEFIVLCKESNNREINILYRFCEEQKLPSRCPIDMVITTTLTVEQAVEFTKYLLLIYQGM